MSGRAISAFLVLAMAGGSLLALPATEVRGPAAATVEHMPPPEQRVDINRAGIEELMTVPGMTHSWAARIVRFRPYRSKADLVERGVLPTDVYDRIKDYVIAHREKK